MKKKKKAVKGRAKRFLYSIRQELFLVFLSLGTLLVFVPIFTYAYFAKDLTSEASVMNRNNTGLILLDRSGKEFFKFYEAKYKKQVPLSYIPEHVRQAIIVAEDKDFYSHPGFSIRAMFAAVIADIREGDFAYGGSTITQQLVKNSLLTPKKNFLRKYQEIVLAQEIERRFTKDQILEMYLNAVYFGEGAFGIEAASQTYFGKSVNKLTVSEASILAGIITAPSRLSPTTGDEESAKKRQQYVLAEMLEERYITRTQKALAERETLIYASESAGFPYRAPHFALMVKEELEEKYGEEQVARSGFKIYTTLDLSWQEYAEDVVAEQVRQLGLSNVSNGAAVVIDSASGEVRVAVGSRDWYNEENGKVNMVTTPRQPGSAFKPIIYAKALEEKIITNATVLRDSPTTFPGNYRPKNYDEKFRGSVLTRRALANSLNVPAVDVMQKVGVEEGLEFAKSLGLSTLGDPSQYGLSLVLGTGEVQLLELTNVYATFSNGGMKNEATLIKRIEDKKGDLVYEYKPKPERALDEEVAFLISSILSDNAIRREVFGGTLDTVVPAAVKTGTTEDYKDSLTMGYTPSIAVGVWVGNNNNQAMNRVAGSLGAAPIWKSLITKFSDGKPIRNFEPPSGLIKLAICPSNGLLLRGASRSAPVEYFIPGTQPTRFCTFERPKVTISPTDPNATQQPTTQPTSSEDKKDDNNGNNGNGNGNGNEPGRGGQSFEGPTSENAPASSEDPFDQIRAEIQARRDERDRQKALDKASEGNN